MLGTADTIVTNIVSYGLGDYSKIFNKLRTQEETLDNVKKTNKTIGRIKSRITSSSQDGGIFRRRSRNSYNLNNERTQNQDQRVENIVEHSSYSPQDSFSPKESYPPQESYSTQESYSPQESYNINHYNDERTISSLENITIDNTTQTTSFSQSNKSTQSNNQSVHFRRSDSILVLDNNNIDTNQSTNSDNIDTNQSTNTDNINTNQSINSDNINNEQNIVDRVNETSNNNINKDNVDSTLETNGKKIKSNLSETEKRKMSNTIARQFQEDLGL